MKKCMYLMCIVCAVALVAGCGGPKAKKIKEPVKSSRITNDPNEPEWVSRGNGLYEGDYGKALYAVGSARNAPSYHIEMSQARARARQELSSMLSVQVQSMTKDFTETAADLYDKDTQSAVEYFQSVSREITNNVLVGSQEVAKFKASDGTMFIYMKIPLNTIVEAFKAETKKALKRKKTREELGIKTDKALEQMDKAIDKSAEKFTNKVATEVK